MIEAIIVISILAILAAAALVSIIIYLALIIKWALFG